MMNRSPYIRTILKFGLLVFIGWILFDLFAPHRSDLKEFDPASVAKLETDMWKSYYARRPVLLFMQLSELLRTQYHLPFLKSNYVSYEATRAAFIFKKGRSRTDYEKALPYLVKYYQAIRNAGDAVFDVNRVAKLELEWWIIHREQKKHPSSDLDNALAAVQSEIYGLPQEVFQQHARLRAESMLLRDELAEKGGVSNDNWKRINQLLDASWKSLLQALH